MKVFLIDNQILFREGLVSLFNDHQDFEVVGEAATAEETLEVMSELEPDLILIDPNFPYGNDLEALKTIALDCPNATIVILTNHDSEELLIQSFRAGASGYLLKNTPISKLIISLRAIEKGEAVLSRVNTTRLIREFKRLHHQPAAPLTGFEHLTEREMQVLTQLAQGLSNTEIAENLVISINTVKVHIHNILAKLDLKNRREAGLVARGLILDLPYGKQSNGNNNIEKLSANNQQVR